MRQIPLRLTKCADLEVCHAPTQPQVDPSVGSRGTAPGSSCYQHSALTACDAAWISAASLGGGRRGGSACARASRRGARVGSRTGTARPTPGCTKTRRRNTVSRHAQGDGHTTIYLHRPFAYCAAVAAACARCSASARRHLAAGAERIMEWDEASLGSNRRPADALPISKFAQPVRVEVVVTNCAR